MPSHDTDQREKPEFPFEVGQVVGHHGYRAEVARIDPERMRVLLAFRSTPKPWKWWVSIGDVTDPPPLAPDVQAAADEFAAFVGNPQSIFERGK